jgi:hypothetical protein
LLCKAQAPAGTEAQVGLPAGASLSGRVVRFENGQVTIAFRQDTVTGEKVDRALDEIKHRQRSVAA